MDPASWHYPRPDLARRTLTALTGGPAAAMTLFGPRRTGKTEFLLRDLAPAGAEARGRHIVYASFWATGAAPLATLLYECAMALRPKGVIERLGQAGRALPLRARIADPLTGSVLELDLTARSAPGVDDLLRLDAALDRLANPATPALLLLDEAQELAAGPEGAALVAALRTALDRRREGIRTVFSGSSRSGLDRMFSARAAPFYRFAVPLTLPPLDDGFVDHQLAQFARVFRRQLDRQTARAQFHAGGGNPMLFQQWLIRMGTEPELTAEAAASLVAAEMAEALGFDRRWRDLPPLARAMARLVAEGRTGLFGAEAAPRLAALLGTEAPGPAARQSALRLLVRRGILDAVEGERRFADPLFESFVLALDPERG